jgi:bifunctional N-acetylglucosamine-1-phosphate-uridyltransferase/glucosamine-1-phosphate-acetyltransferase GlmU-like protein
VFESPAVFKNLKSINSQNAQNEYYLPDMVKVCNSQNLKTDSLILSNSLESTGVNSPEDLKYLETLISEGRLTV